MAKLTKDQRIELIGAVDWLISSSSSNDPYGQEDPTHIAELIVKIAPANKIRDMISEMKAHRKFRGPYPIPYEDRAPGQWRPLRYR